MQLEMWNTTHPFEKVVEISQHTRRVWMRRTHWTSLIIFKFLWNDWPQQAHKKVFTGTTADSVAVFVHVILAKLTDKESVTAKNSVNIAPSTPSINLGIPRHFVRKVHSNKPKDHQILCRTSCPFTEGKLQLIVRSSCTAYWCCCICSLMWSC